jgi:urease accessory protein
MTHEAPHHPGENDLVFTKVVAVHAQLAATLLKNALILPLTWEERQAPPYSVRLPDGQTAFLPIDAVLNVGDRLLATNNRWAIVTAAEEALLQLSGPVEALIAAAHTLGEHHEPAMFHEGVLFALPNTTARELATALHLEATGQKAALIPILVHLPDEHYVDHDDTHHDHAGHVHGPGCGHQH